MPLFGGMMPARPAAGSIAVPMPPANRSAPSGPVEMRTRGEGEAAGDVGEASPNGLCRSPRSTLTGVVAPRPETLPA